ncbi:VCBS repeat-containing protein [Flavobacteriaceae bacterium]|nr:VCBS repeat-containing protein [Flavobacteriaceae bacterium]
MKKLISLLSIFAIVLSCSSDETSTPITPPPAPIVKYTITLSAGDGGTVSTTGGEYEAGQTVSVTATPQGEYVFTSWSDGITDATRTITVSSNTTLTANFEKKKYPLTVNIEGEGEVLEEIVNAGRTTDYDSGTTVKLTAVPAEGWEFIGWTGAIESTELEVQLLISEAKEVKAEFRKVLIQHTKSIIEGDSDKVVTGFNFSGLIQFDDNNIFFSPTNFFNYPTYPLLHIKRDSLWNLNKVYDDMHMQVVRDYKKLSENSFVFVDHGLEIGQEIRDQEVDLSILDMGEVYKFDFINDQLTRTTLSPNRGFYHSVAVGDLDLDNKVDIIAMYMALPSDVSDNKEGTMMYMFSETDNSNYIETTDKLKTLGYESTFSGAVIIDDFNGDSKDDLIKFSYKTPVGFEARQEFLYSYLMMGINNESGLIEMNKRKDRFNEYPVNFGIAWARSDDVDKDGDKDLIVHMEKGNGTDMIQVWTNDGTGDFTYNQTFFTDTSEFNSRDFEVFDFDNDGDLDVFLQPFGAISYPVDFSKYIYVNNNGVFEKYQNSIIWDFDPKSDQEVIPLVFLKFITIDSKPGFLGINNYNIPDGQLEFHEFILNLN